MEVFLHGAAFVLGFSVCFIAFGAAASALSMFLFAGKAWITRVGGAVIFVLGLHLAGILRLPFLETDRRWNAEPRAGIGYLASFLAGAFFSIGWSACTGPILGAVLTLAASEGSLSTGVAYLAAYSLGMAIPFLVMAAAIDRIGPWVRRLGRFSKIITVAAGLLFAAMGVLLMLGRFSLLAQWLPVVETGAADPAGWVRWPV
jgi:cytochrome c-type biogenesis protein